MSTDVMIYANDLSKSFGSFRAVDKINFEVRRGEVVGFLGPNGAGKSTTMRVLTCFISPTNGSARVNGYDVFDDSLGVRRSLGYLPQPHPNHIGEVFWVFAAQPDADFADGHGGAFKSRQGGNQGGARRGGQLASALVHRPVGCHRCAGHGD